MKKVTKIIAIALLATALLKAPVLHQHLKDGTTTHFSIATCLHMDYEEKQFVTPLIIQDNLNELVQKMEVF